MSTKYYQQGDVLLKTIGKLPDGLEKHPDLILQYGESTGHMHQFPEGSDVQVFYSHEKQKKYIVVGNVAYLRHEEHREIPVQPGIFEVDIVREYDYDSKETRRVID